MTRTFWRGCYTSGTVSPSKPREDALTIPSRPAKRGPFHSLWKNLCTGALTPSLALVHILSIEALHSPSGGPQASPLFHIDGNLADRSRQRYSASNKFDPHASSGTGEQTALPLPATGDQTAPKGCPRQGQPCTADEGETPKPRERPGHAMRPATPAVMGQNDSPLPAH